MGIQTWTTKMGCSTQKYEVRLGTPWYDLVQLSRPGYGHDTTLVRLFDGLPM